MKFKAAIFDLDGVIVETVQLHFKAWKRMFNEFGKEFTFDDYKNKVDGIPRLDGCRAILIDADDKVIEQASQKKQDYYIEYLDAEGVKVFDTTIVLIKDLIASNIKTAVVSSSRNCPYILDKMNIRDLFLTQISGNDIKKGKPDPGIFLMAADRLNVPSEGCVVFEDAALGVEAGKRAGMVTIGIDRNNKPNLLAKADIIVTDLGEVTTERINSLFE